MVFVVLIALNVREKRPAPNISSSGSLLHSTDKGMIQCSYLSKTDEHSALTVISRPHKAFLKKTKFSVERGTCISYFLLTSNEHVYENLILQRYVSRKSIGTNLRARIAEWKELPEERFPHVMFEGPNGLRKDGVYERFYDRLRPTLLRGLPQPHKSQRIGLDQSAHQEASLVLRRGKILMVPV